MCTRGDSLVAADQPAVGAMVTAALDVSPSLRAPGSLRWGVTALAALEWRPVTGQWTTPFGVRAGL